MKRLLNKFYGLFFGREHAAPLGFFRILVGMLILATFLVEAPYITEYYTDEGFVPNEAITTQFRDYRFSLLDYTPSPIAVHLLYVLFLLSAFFFTIGYKTRIAGILTFILLLSFNERNWLLVTGADSIYRAIMFVLMISNAGAAYSVDALLAKLKNKSPQDVPKWQRLLLKYQASVIYFFAGFAKSGKFWTDGSAAYYSLANPSFARFSLDWLNQVPLMVNAMTYGTLFIELSVPFLLWFPQTRLIAIAMVAFLQLLIFGTVSIGTFPLIAIVVVLIFLEKSDIDSLWHWLGKRMKRSEILYDGSCAFCTRCMDVIRTLDVCQCFTCSNFRTCKLDKNMKKELEQELMLITPEKKYKGFFAFRKMALHIPAFWILVPLLYLPFASVVGTRVYAFVARNRFRISCKTCGVDK